MGLLKKPQELLFLLMWEQCKGAWEEGDCSRVTLNKPGAQPQRTLGSVRDGKQELHALLVLLKPGVESG